MKLCTCDLTSAFIALLELYHKKSESQNVQIFHMISIDCVSS